MASLHTAPLGYEFSPTLVERGPLAQPLRYQWGTVCDEIHTPGETSGYPGASSSASVGGSAPLRETVTAAARAA